MTPFWTKLRSALRAFRISRDGNVALIFAFATIPIILGVGFAVDYSRANQVKTALQAALDSTALMISKEAASDTPDQLQTNALKYFTALFTPSNASNISLTATYSTNGGTQVVINGSANVSTSFLGLVGYNNLTVSNSSTVKWGSTKLRVALVLDNTGSMADNGKIDALKTATANLLTQLQNAAATNGDVYVSIIPFVKDVNLNPSEWNSDWIYWGTAAQDTTLSDNNSWDANNGSCSSGSYSTRSSCIAHSSCSISSDHTQTSCTGDGTCSLSSYTSQSSCTSAGTCSLSSYTSQGTCTAAGTCSLSGYTNSGSCTGAGTCSLSGHTNQTSCQSAGTCSKSQYTSSSTCSQHSGHWTAGVWTAGVWTTATWTATPGTWTAGVWAANTWTPNNHNTWNGCVMDRGYSTTPDTVNNYDTNVVQPDPITPRWSSLYPAEQYSSCPQAAMGLSYDWTTMNSLVSAMSPNGSTNQAIGLQLGWMSLVGGGPFTSPAMDPNYTYNQVIILLTDGLNTQDRWYGNGSTTSTQVDARQTLTCSNIKASGIIIYTIQVNTGGDPTSTLLQNCASSSDKFFLLTSANQIITTFNQIGTNLSNLYVAR